MWMRVIDNGAKSKGLVDGGLVYLVSEVEVCVPEKGFNWVSEEDFQPTQNIMENEEVSWAIDEWNHW